MHDFLGSSTGRVVLGDNLAVLAASRFHDDRIYGLGAAYSILTFITVMIVAAIYIRTVGGNIRGLAED